MQYIVGHPVYAMKEKNLNLLHEFQKHAFIRNIILESFIFLTKKPVDLFYPFPCQKNTLII